MITIAGSKKAAGVRKLFKPSAKSFLAAAYPEDNPGTPAPPVPVDLAAPPVPIVLLVASVVMPPLGSARR
jgi:hypothetical protein